MNNGQGNWRELPYLASEEIDEFKRLNTAQIPMLPSIPAIHFDEFDATTNNMLYNDWICNVTRIEDGNYSEGTAPLENEIRGNERGARRVHFDSSVVVYLFETNDEPHRVVDNKRFAYPHDAKRFLSLSSLRVIMEQAQQVPENDDSVIVLGREQKLST
ncbi:hypothetical protein MAM1_0672c11105 [Mucor ambiguus]|uniref:Uncharacterized protein n=1 Tax=Mucor ambiguus TaxID=91626 RepID=A0A0C9MVW1_9FUNG|nr:hypothetical protein MAM1_0672c11105 [Mucor ambiguus]